MTTSVVFGDSTNSRSYYTDFGSTLLTTAGLTSAQIWKRINILDSAPKQTVGNSGTSANYTTAAWGTTPVDGNLLVAVMFRASTNTVSAGPSGWTHVVDEGGSGRRIEVWYKIASSDTTSALTFTVATSVAWDIRLFEFSVGDQHSPRAGIVVGQVMATNNASPGSGTSQAATIGSISGSFKAAYGISVIAMGGTVTGLDFTSATNISSLTKYDIGTIGGMVFAVPPHGWADAASMTGTWAWGTSRTISIINLFIVGVGESDDASSAQARVGTSTSAVIPFCTEVLQNFPLPVPRAGDVPVTGIIESATLTMSRGGGDTGNTNLNTYWVNTDLSIFTDPLQYPFFQSSSFINLLYQRVASAAVTSGTTGLMTFTSDPAMLHQLVSGTNNILLTASDEAVNSSTVSADNYALLNTPDAAGTTNDPALTIVWHPFAPGTIPSRLPVKQASNW